MQRPPSTQPASEVALSFSLSAAGHVGVCSCPPAGSLVPGVDTAPTVFRSPLPPAPRRRGLAHAGRRAAGAWRQVVPSTRPEEGPRLPGVLAVAWAPAVGRGRGQSCGMRTLSARPCPGEGHVCPASQRAFSPTRRPRGFPLERLQCLGRHRGGNRVRISPALQGKPGRQPRGPLSWALSAWWSPPRGAGAEWACVWRQAAVRSALRGVQVQVRPPPGRVHSAGSAPASPTGLGISPRSPCPAGRLRGRRSVGRVRPAVRGTGFWGDQMAWRLSVDGEPSRLCRIRPCHAGDVWPQAPWSRLYGGDSGPCLTRLSRSPRVRLRQRRARGGEGALCPPVPPWRPEPASRTQHSRRHEACFLFPVCCVGIHVTRRFFPGFIANPQDPGGHCPQLSEHLPPDPRY